MSNTEMHDFFDPEQFRTSGHILIDLLANQLASTLQGNAGLIKWQSPLEADKAWQEVMPEHPDLQHTEFTDWISQAILPRNLNMHHPHSLAHQAAPPLPMAALADLVAAFSNQAMAVYETGPAATLVERQLIRWLSKLVGWPQGNGVLTSGGSQANLTALLAARQVMDESIWNTGMSDKPKLRILTSTLSHYSISRAAGIMGLGSNAIMPIAVDHHGRMLISALKQAHEQCLAHHEQVMAVVATAGCTATGSIDPLQEIGAYCRDHQLWLHIDAAHGASALLSEQHGEKLQGISLADSVVWDAHKLLFMPATVSAVLFRDEGTSYSAFAQSASYLFHEEDKETALGFNSSYRTLECTKRMMGLKLLSAFKLYGKQGLATLIDHVFSLADQFSKLVINTPGFTLLMPPQTNIVCFRYEGHGPETYDPDQLNCLQSTIRQQLLHQERFHLSQVNFEDKTWLRCTFMNPLTDHSYQQNLLNTIKQVGNSALTEISP